MDWTNISIAGAFVVGFAAGSLVVVRLIRVVKGEASRPVDVPHHKRDEPGA